MRERGSAVLPDGGPPLCRGGSAAQGSADRMRAGAPDRAETGAHNGDQAGQGAVTTVAGWMTGIHSRWTAMATTVTVPRLVTFTCRTDVNSGHSGDSFKTLGGRRVNLPSWLKNNNASSESSHSGGCSGPGC